MVRFRATLAMKAYRLESGMSWADFRRMWGMVCNYLNAPINHILLENDADTTGEKHQKMFALIQEVMHCGIFAPHSRGVFHVGAYPEEPDKARLHDFLFRVINYASGFIKDSLAVQTATARENSRAAASSEGTHGNRAGDQVSGPMGDITPSETVPA